MFSDVYKDKIILVTGHTGFKGSWLTTWLHQLGAKVTGLSISLPSTPCNFEASGLDQTIDTRFVDICDAEAVKKSLLMSSLTLYSI